ncbi:receptor-like protein EIX1 [Abrus precatorius]|uniref:Receptor-like protein EIX1 n=1 Tax=Abrus precatorius TaxID=3816 RepID=A0A8B8LQS4_ABRPR|nr:receptor-like protein EIX1 [Abrus precatorius]
MDLLASGLNTLFCVSAEIVSPKQAIRCIQREREALLQFKATLVDDYNMLSSWTTPDCCQWRGIRCSNLTAHSRFGGKIPSQFGSLSHLKYLNLSGNYLGGSIPYQLGNLSMLQHLDLSGNYLEGNIPSQLGNLSTLQHLDLRGNHLEGNIPSQLGNLFNFQNLYLDGYYGALKMDDGNHGGDNFLLSMRPSKFNVSTSLSVLDLSENTIASSIIFQWGSNITSNLVELDLGGNLLEAPPSNHFGMVMNSLHRVDLSYNRFKDEVLKSFMNICTLCCLYLRGNNLTEDLPSILHDLSSGCVRNSLLEELDLSSNKITGSLPHLLIFSSLEMLDLSGNQLSGRIPQESLAVRESIPKSSVLSFNQLKKESGVANSFQNAGTLQSLYPSNNSLSEELPTIIHHLSRYARYSLQLDSLDLSDNSLALAFTHNWVPPFQLSYIQFRSCKLGPAFPKWLQTQDNYRTIDISDAGISDIVPRWFWAKLASQESMRMNISHNNLIDVVPNFPLKNPQYSLILASNQFEGPIPPFLRRSMFLDLSNNKFSSSLPFLCASGVAETLYRLYHSNNELSGQIPDCWSHFKSLVYLDLSHKFSGKIPTSIGSLLQLQALLLRNNNLTEEIPFSLRSCTKLMIDMAENGLSGPIPNWIGSTLQVLQNFNLIKESILWKFAITNLLSKKHSTLGSLPQ